MGRDGQEKKKLWKIHFHGCASDSAESRWFPPITRVCVGVCVCVRGVTDRPKKIIISVCNICDVPTASRHLLFCFVVFSSFFLKFFPSISSLSLSLSLSFVLFSCFTSALHPRSRTRCRCCIQLTKHTKKSKKSKKKTKWQTNNGHRFNIIFFSSFFFFLEPLLFPIHGAGPSRIFVRFFLPKKSNQIKSNNKKKKNHRRRWQTGASGEVVSFECEY